MNSGDGNFKDIVGGGGLDYLGSNFIATQGIN